MNWAESVLSEVKNPETKNPETKKPEVKDSRDFIDLTKEEEPVKDDVQIKKRSVQVRRERVQVSDEHLSIGSLFMRRFNGDMVPRPTSNRQSTWVVSLYDYADRGIDVLWVNSREIEVIADDDRIRRRLTDGLRRYGFTKHVARNKRITYSHPYFFNGNSNNWQDITTK
jgi:hypothetical protein